MTHRSFLQLSLFRLALATVLLSPPVSSHSADVGDCGSVAALDDAVVRLAADRIGAVLDSVADSTRALGNAYARLEARRKDQAPSAAARWNALRTTVGRTTGLRTWPDGAKDEPGFQAPYPGFYSYGGAELDDRVLHQLDTFEQFAPMVRTAYESFPFSWVYVTTPDDTMLIYPYLPIAEAVHNAMPTRTPFYRAANFEQRTVGWTPPYLDLVGAGMMITASYPIYDGAELLGVVSRDITLKELTERVLSNLTRITGSTTLIVDGRGLAIAASDPDLAAEIDRVNGKAGAAALYYREAEGIAAVGEKDAVASSSQALNATVEQVLEQADKSAGTVRFARDDNRVLAQRIGSTDWLVVLLMADGKK